MTIAKNLANIKNETQGVTVVAVSKKQPTEKILQAHAAGQEDFAENYLQEALEKIPHLTKTIRWHFIGAIQSNKTRLIAENFSWVQTLCREKIAGRLNEERPETMLPLNVCVQINSDAEQTKSGLLPDEAEDFMAEILPLKNLALRGIMVIPKAREKYQAQYEHFIQVAELFQRLQKKYPSLDTLSMGMSQDYLAAVAAGSTMVRIGTAIFGPREKD